VQQFSIYAAVGAAVGGVWRVAYPGLKWTDNIPAGATAVQVRGRGAATRICVNCYLLTWLVHVALAAALAFAAGSHHMYIKMSEVYTVNQRTAATIAGV
jgi:hypothetical protein